MRPDSGWERLPAQRSEEELRIGEHKVMKRWETPLMRTMAERLCSAVGHGHIVEVGFGMGLSAAFLQAARVARHTIVEPHPECLARLDAWRRNLPDRDITIVADYWQNALHLFEDCDGVFFDTYADSRSALIEENLEFLCAAATRLRLGASVALFWILPTLDEAQQRCLYRHYRRVEIVPVPVEPGQTGVAPLRELGFLLSIVATR